MANDTQKVFELKRQIEREFAELFPNEPPYVVAKIEDTEGFALSNSSLIADVARANDKLVALPEEGATQAISPSSQVALHGGQNAAEHLEALRNFQTQVLNKLAISGVATSQQIDLQRFLHAIVPLGFQPYEQTQTRNVALIISKALDYNNVVDLFREDA